MNAMIPRLTICLLAAVFAACLETSSPTGTGNRPNDDSTCTDFGSRWQTVGGDGSHSLRVVYPNGGETFRPGDSLYIEPGCDTSTGEYWCIEIELSVDGGRSWVMIPGNGAWWTEVLGCIELPIEGCRRPLLVVPDSIDVTEYEPNAGGMVTRRVPAVSDKCLLRVHEYGGEEFVDQMDGVFTVAGD